MRKITTILAGIILVTASVFAQSPEKMSYQAVIRDASDNLLISQSIDIKISILQESDVVVYAETQTSSTNANGLVSLEIGSGTLVSGDFTTIDWSNGPYFIETEINHNGFTDTRDGNHYDVVEIGGQIWMAENLAYLPSVNAPADGSEDAAGSYYYVHGYNGTDVAAAKATSNYDTYGVLYNWTAAMAGSASSSSNPSGIQGVCPTGWHLPSDAEWTELTDFLGSAAGGKLKEAGTTHWSNPNTRATNETGFTALPGGARGRSETFGYIRDNGYWWSATEYYASNAWYRSMNDGSSNVGRSNSNQELGLSVRCVRD